jgi:nucleotide-binding universal stress UspA family protein
MTKPPDGHEGRIVVGVDGSAASKAALAWAIRQAARTDSVVEAVTAYYWFPMPIEEPDFRGLAAHVLDDAILDESSVGPAVKIISKVVHGSAAKVLLDAARGAELVVVGNRGHGGFTGALLGSVSQNCVHYAACPVVIVRAPAAKPQSRAEGPEPTGPLVPGAAGNPTVV